MRALGACLFLFLRCGRAVRLGRPQEEGGALVCRATCQQKGLGNESRSCPFAQFLEGQYYYWRHWRGCNAGHLRVDLSCGDLQPGGYAEEVRRQLGGKHVVIIGDSTMRQTYIGLLCLLWEEGLVSDDPHRAVESKQRLIEKEDRGFIETKLPELGDGTKLTYVRKDWGQPGPMMMSVLDTADITVANLAMHYSSAVGLSTQVLQDGQGNHTVRYTEDVTSLLTNISARGRPGHRAFWREALVCPKYFHENWPDTVYGCDSEPNPTLRSHNSVVAKLPAFEGVEVLPVSEMFLRFWWAHPGGHDCCHMVGRVPGLLASVSRMLISMLAHPHAKGVEVDRAAAACPQMWAECEEERVEEDIFGEEAF